MGSGLESCVKFFLVAQATNQYWTQVVTILVDNELDFIIEHHQVQINVATQFPGATAPLSAVKVYLFTPSEGYLGLNASTDVNGQVFFHLPLDEYKVRVDYLGSQYFSEAFSTDEYSVNITEGQANVYLRSGEQALADVEAAYVAAAKEKGFL